jgi:ABC-type multidrug transport system fused ATPase/permease subunit
MIRKNGYIGKVLALLTPGEKRRLWVVLAGSILAALIEAMGIGSIMPFVTVASKPPIIHENHYLSTAFKFLGFSNDISFMIFLGVAVLAMLIITNLSQAFLHYIKIRFTSYRRNALSLRLLSGYLRQPFIFFLNKNSYDFVKNINAEIGQMINVTLMQLVELLTRIIQVSLLILFLVLVNPASTLFITTGIILIYGVIYLSVKRTVRRLGAERFSVDAERARIVSEAFWGIKELKLAAGEKEIIAEYTRPSRHLARIETIAAIFSDIPKFALETAAFSSIILFVLITIIRSGGFGDAAGAITLFAYAGYRLIPAVQALFRALTQLRYGAAPAEKITGEFKTVAGGEELPKSRPERLPFRKLLELQSVRFSYPNADAPVIENLSMSLPANSMIGLAGRTGSGKTTLVDIIMGLLVIQSGSITVDGVRLCLDNMRNWQSNVGYVPQSIYLSNDSIAANIAFGVSKERIDLGAVERAGRLAQLHEFVTESLPQSYDTAIGERGIRLSGGQRQRIGIARALYREPSVLIMDEATSALDSHTERAVMEAIDTLQGTRTIILIAHRLTTLKKCDVIYLLEKGKIVDSGTFAELHDRSTYFST